MAIVLCSRWGSFGGAWGVVAPTGSLRCALATLAVLAIASWSASFVASGDEPQTNDQERKSAALRAASAHMRRMTLHRADNAGQKIPLVEKPLLSFGDLARVYDHGTLWCWGATGRPVAFLELFQQPKTDSGTWTQSITLAGMPDVVLETPENGRWEPQTTAVEWDAVPDSPPPGDKEPVRLRQLKDIARRFAAHEIWDPNRSRYELRLLVQPVHRYSDPDDRIHDGAVFVFAHATNPECLLLIEAAGGELTSAQWKYALLRSSDAEVHVALDGKEMWTCERQGRTSGEKFKPYWAFHCPLEATKIEPE